MEMDERRIREIVAQVVAGIKEVEQRPAEPAPEAPTVSAPARAAVVPGKDGVFEEMDAAIDAALRAGR